MGSPAALSPFQLQAYAAIEAAESKGLVPYQREVTHLAAAYASQKAALGNAVKLKKAEEKITKLSVDISQRRAELISECELIYARAISSTEPFVLGGAILRSSSPAAVSIIKNFGVLSGTSHQAPHAALGHSWGDRPIDLSTGAILCDGSWSVFKNDCAMLGIIHAGRTCYVSNLNGTGETSDLIDDLWEGSRPKVLGREIAMLYAADYRQVTPDDLVPMYGHVFVPTKREILPKVTLTKLIERMDKVGSVAKLFQMLEFFPDPCVTPKKASPAASPSVAELSGGASTPFSPFTAYSPSALKPASFYAGGGGGEEEVAFGLAKFVSAADDSFASLVAGGAAAPAAGPRALDHSLESALLAHTRSTPAGSPMPLPSPATVGEVKVSAEEAAALGILKPMPKSPERVAKVACGGGAAAIKALVSARQLSFQAAIEEEAKAMAKPEENS